MKIKEINIMQDCIEIKEEKKGFFGIKNYISKIDMESIDKIERIIDNDRFVGFIFWHEETVVHGIGIKNYDDDLENIYNKIIQNINSNSIEIVETIL